MDGDSSSEEVISPSKRTTSRSRAAARRKRDSKKIEQKEKSRTKRTSDEASEFECDEEELEASEDVMVMSDEEVESGLDENGNEGNENDMQGGESASPWKVQEIPLSRSQLVGTTLTAGRPVPNENDMHIDENNHSDEEIARESGVNALCEPRILKSYPFIPSHLAASGGRFFADIDLEDQEEIVKRVNELFGRLLCDTMTPDNKEGQLTTVYAYKRSVQVYQRISELRRLRQTSAQWIMKKTRELERENDAHFPSWMPQAAAMKPVSTPERFLPDPLTSPSFKFATTSWEGSENAPINIDDEFEPNEQNKKNEIARAKTKKAEVQSQVALSLRRFDSLLRNPSGQEDAQCHRDILFNAGGPIQSLAWLPLSTPNPCAVNYVAVAAHKSDTTFPYSERHGGAHAIQIWEIGILNPLGRPRSEEKPRLVLALAHQGACVRQLQWLQGGSLNVLNDGVEGTSPRLGLLAALDGAGDISIFAVPHPSSLPPNIELSAEYPIANIMPCLKLHYDAVGAMTCFHWSPIEPNLLVAGTADGRLLVWKITDNKSDLAFAKSPLVEVNRVGPDAPLTCFSPITEVAVSGGCTVESVRFSSEWPLHVLINSADQYVRVFDIRQPHTPVLVKGRFPGAFWVGQDMDLINFLSDDGSILPRSIHNVSDTQSKKRNRRRLVSNYHDGFIWSMSYSELVRETATCGADGAVMLSPPSKGVDRTAVQVDRILYDEGMNTFTFLDSPEYAWDVDWVSHKSKKAEVTPKKASESKQKGKKNEKKEKTGHSKKVGEKEAVDEEESGRLQQREGTAPTRRFPPRNIGVHRIEWNPNVMAYNWIIYGGHNGLVRAQAIRWLLPEPYDLSTELEELPDLDTFFTNPEWLTPEERKASKFKFNEPPHPSKKQEISSLKTGGKNGNKRKREEDDDEQPRKRGRPRKSETPKKQGRPRKNVEAEENERGTANEREEEEKEAEKEKEISNHENLAKTRKRGRPRKGSAKALTDFFSARKKEKERNEEDSEEGEEKEAKEIAEKVREDLEATGEKSTPNKGEKEGQRKSRGRPATSAGKAVIVCAECGKQYKSRFGYTIHRRSHTGERPYVCPICNMGFTNKVHMDYHVRTVH